MSSLADLMPADVEPHVGSLFAVADPDRNIVLALVAVDRYGAQPAGPREEPFSLVFVGPPDMLLEQRIHALEHDVLGRMELFLVPIGPGPDGRPRYEAVFN